MKQRRKDNHCLNCNLRVESIYNYCPQCGQENTNNKVSVIELLKDLYDDYMTVDSRFFKSLKPFILQPGALTNAFNEGHRIRYVHPVRFYLLISLVYFFVFTHVFDFENLPFNEINKEINQSDSISIDKDSVQNPAKKEKKLTKLKKQLTSLQKQITNAKDKDNKDFVQDSMVVLQKIKYLQPLIDSLEKNSKAIVHSGLINNKLEAIEEKYEQKSQDTSDGNMRIHSFEQFQRIVQNKKTTDKALLDSLGQRDKDELRLKLAKQMLKIGRNDLSIFLQTIIDNIPIMMILLLPFMALFLKIIYIRSERLYIEHLVFAFHMQSFVYLVISVFLVLFYLTDYQYLEKFSVAFLGILVIYVVAMFRNVYQQGMLKTIIKSWILSWMYFITLIIFLVAEVLVSFLVY
jgi:hypothetical protein